MGFSETPIFAGKIDNQQANVAGGSATTTALFTADATYGGLITGLTMYEKGAGARTCRLELKTGSTVTVLSRFATSGVQYTKTNLFTSTYLAFLNDNDPVLRLKPGQLIQLVTEGTEANALDITAIGGSYEYPNP